MEGSGAVMEGPGAVRGTAATWRPARAGARERACHSPGQASVQRPQGFLVLWCCGVARTGLCWKAQLGGGWREGLSGGAPDGPGEVFPV